MSGVRNYEPFVFFNVSRDAGYVAVRERRTRATHAVNALHELCRDAEQRGAPRDVLALTPEVEAAWNEYVAAAQACRDYYIAFLTAAVASDPLPT